MDITLKNLGPISEANFTVGDLTIICGKNNTGKTYITYATYGFFSLLKNYRFNLFDYPFVADILKSQKPIRIKYSDLNKNLIDELIRFSSIYKEQLNRIFASSNIQVTASHIGLNMLSNEGHKRDLTATYYVEDGGAVTINLSNKDDCYLDLDLIVTLGFENRPDLSEVIADLNYWVKEIILPKVFMASAERTGAALFQREIDFNRSGLIDILKETNANPQQLLGRFTAEYPLPVKHNIDFVRDLPNIISKQSEFSRQYPEILLSFAQLLGGDYQVNNVGGISYSPTSQPDLKLTLAESSSTVRSLVDIGFYLKHLAKKGALLMVDEPELNLHPENQRKIARLFAMLVNAGIRVFITTHSDYIIKEFNTLLLLNKEDERLQQIAKREGYQPNELLKPEQLNIYMTAPDTNVVDRKAYALLPAQITAENGIELKTFDDTIEDMNRIQDEIVWG